MSEPVPDKDRQASRRARELAKGRRQRVFFLTDGEFARFKMILEFLRDTPESQCVDVTLTRTQPRDER